MNNLDNDPQKIYRKVYDKLYEKCDPNSIPQIILSIPEYQYKSYLWGLDQEINLMSCLVGDNVECKVQVNYIKF